jgi:precorrin-8X/cobalt-precorrin-8 methylmutase
VDDPEVTKLAKESGRTRAETAIERLGAELNGCIVAIGNAPTALFALLDLVDQGAVQPALVAGIPVGFVGAAESKAELVKRNIPYITLTGSRGGSPLAAAAINALIRQARNS